MKRLLFVAAVAVTAACARNHANVKEATVEQVAEWVKAGSATVVDANNESFRKTNGTVPGALLLASYNDYDVSVLGDDKARQIVFYCSNRM